MRALEGTRVLDLSHVIAGLLACLSLGGCGDKPAPLNSAPAVVFRAPPADPFHAPHVREIALPAMRGVEAIWGALGRDTRGRILIGASSRVGGAAHLLAFDTSTLQVADLGTPPAALKAAGKLREGEGQNKLHSRFVRAADGRVYFSSFDEAGESQAREVLPRWGGHLWRLGHDGSWQHVLAAREALIAVGAGGQSVYALGYWGHVLFAHHVRTGVQRQVVVGALGGHVSRNLLVDARGHAYVPRLREEGGKVSATLVAYDEELREVAEVPMPEYVEPGVSPAQSHGIVGVVALADATLLFTTQAGRLYRLKPRAQGPAELIDHGWFHPQGKAYAPGLFTFSGQQLIAGLAIRQGTGYEWVVHDLATGTAGAFALPLESYRGLQLFGSEARDDVGRFYVGGRAADADGRLRPVLLQLSAD